MYEKIMSMLEKTTIAEMWDDWDAIASSVIPLGFDMRNAAEGAYSTDCDTEEAIRDRIEYLSDRMDPARCYWLDYRIRCFLGKEIRA